MRLVTRWVPAPPPRLSARVIAGTVMLVIAPVFYGAVALAQEPATVAAAHHLPIATHRTPQSHAKARVTATTAAPPVVVVLSKAALSRPPSQSGGAVSLPMSFGQPVAPEDELAATPPPPSTTKHRGGNHVS
jgi:hypothetical protein